MSEKPSNPVASIASMPASTLLIFDTPTTSAESIVTRSSAGGSSASATPGTASTPVISVNRSVFIMRAYIVVPFVRFVPV